MPHRARAEVRDREGVARSCGVAARRAGDDALTRAPGSFVQSVGGLRHALAQPGLIVSVDVVINRKNLPVLREILEHFIAMGVSEFDLLWLVLYPLLFLGR